MSAPDTRDLTAAQCDAAMPTSRALYGDFGPQLWVLPDGEAAPEPSRDRPVNPGPNPGERLGKVCSEAANKYRRKKDGK